MLNKQSFDSRSVTLPDNTTIKLVEKGNTSLRKQLTPSATHAAILPGLTIASLISLGQLCDDNYKVLLDKKSLLMVKDNDLILRRYRNKENFYGTYRSQIQIYQNLNIQRNQTKHVYIQLRTNNPNLSENDDEDLPLITKKRSEVKLIRISLHHSMISLITMNFLILSMKS